MIDTIPMTKHGSLHFIRSGPPLCLCDMVPFPASVASGCVVDAAVDTVSWKITSLDRPP